MLGGSPRKRFASTLLASDFHGGSACAQRELLNVLSNWGIHFFTSKVTPQAKDKVTARRRDHNLEHAAELLVARVHVGRVNGQRNVALHARAHAVREV